MKNERESKFQLRYQKTQTRLRKEKGRKKRPWYPVGSFFCTAAFLFSKTSRFWLESVRCCRRNEVFVRIGFGKIVSGGFAFPDWNDGEEALAFLEFEKTPTSLWSSEW